MHKFKRAHKCQEAISNNFTDFGQSTVLAGLNYISNRKLSAFERLFFTVFFVVTFIVLITLTTNIYAKWDSTPVIVGLTPNPVLIKSIPFPAVTICNVNQARASKVRGTFTRTSVEYSMLQTLCRRSVDNVDASELAVIHNRTYFRRFIEEIAQPCDRLFVSCKFGSVTKNCRELFKPVQTDEGQCCVFNSVHSSFIIRDQKNLKGFINPDGAVAVDWDLQYGYKKHKPDMFYPRVAPGIGISLGLSVVINAEVDDYFCTSRNGPGFKLLLHNPIETPLLRDHGLFFPAGSETSFRISADRSVASENIQSFSIDDRQCVFKSERQLSHFKSYTKRNCELECLANATAKLCGCITYFQPMTSKNLTICSLKDLDCTRTVQNWQPVIASKLNTNGKNCKDMCVQGCFDLIFNPVGFSIPLTSGGYMIKEPMLEEFNATYLKENIAVVHFFYKLSHFDGFMRTRYIGTTEFMSATGGLFGLLGFSFIAVAEIAFFWILRPFKRLSQLMAKYFKNKKESKQKEPMEGFIPTKCDENFKNTEMAKLNKKILNNWVSYKP